MHHTGTTQELTSDSSIDAAIGFSREMVESAFQGFIHNGIHMQAQDVRIMN
jgi:hypothetical protein